MWVCGLRVAVQGVCLSSPSRPGHWLQELDCGGARAGLCSGRHVCWRQPCTFPDQSGCAAADLTPMSNSGWLFSALRQEARPWAGVLLRAQTAGVREGAGCPSGTGVWALPPLSLGVRAGGSEQRLAGRPSGQFLGGRPRSPGRRPAGVEECGVQQPPSS